MSATKNGTKVSHTDEAIDDLRHQCAELRADVERLVDRPATEVRTKRIVVVNDQGREVIYSTQGSDWAQFTVEHQTSDDEQDRVTATIHAGSELAEGAAEVQFGLW